MLFSAHNWARPVTCVIFPSPLNDPAIWVLLTPFFMERETEIWCGCVTQPLDHQLVGGLGSNPILSKSHDPATVCVIPAGKAVGLHLLTVPGCSEFVVHDLILFGYQSRNELILPPALMDPSFLSSTLVRAGVNKIYEMGPWF